MENLNKEFFDELYEKYYKGTEIFFSWLSRYESKNADYFHYNNMIDIYELPLAFQTGIILEFIKSINIHLYYEGYIKDLYIEEEFKLVIKLINNA